MIAVVSVFAADSGNASAVRDLVRCGLLSLVSENQRPSIRYLGEWSLILGSIL
jgi:hypothetical protein